MEKTRICKNCHQSFKIEFSKSGRQKEFCSSGCKQDMREKYKAERKKLYAEFLKWRMNRILEGLAKASLH